MKKFEHLFSQDPIGAFEKIEEDYTRYFEVSYKISNTEINKERMDVLRADNNLSKEPYLEVLPEYSPAEGLRNMDDLVSRFSGHFGGETFAREYFEEFIAKGLMQGLMDKYIPYGHQIGMLEKAFAGIDENGNPLKYKNTVITSGTGSGKTESFMLPLLADIYKEYISSSWAPAISHAKWFEGRIEGRYKKRQYIPNQRLNDPRPAAIRALVLYPMNALVEDQMARLREALDSNDVRAFMHNKMQGNRIYFGSYNGSTIAPKSYDLLNNPDHKTAFTKKKQEVAEQLNKIHEHFEFVNRYVAANPDKKDALYIEPRLGGDLTTSEMITRWDMQYWAPDIMITNTSMLSIMLMRKAESKMFDDTRRWLAAEDLPEAEREEAKKNRVFHIIVDELHLYRGTAGSEVACLLRMLYNAIGLEPVVDDDRGNKVPNPQIKILASSASLGDETETQKFMEEFFGIYSTIEGENVFNVQVGSNYIGKNKDVIIDYTSFSEFNHENFVAIELDPENAGKVEDVRKGKVLNFLKEKFDCDTIEKFCKRYEEQMFKDFYDCLPSNTDNSKRPISQSQLIESLFAGNKEAYRGFLIFRGYIDTIYKNHKLPRFRFHKFFKYVEGLWGELNPSLSDDVPAVKNLSYNSKEVGARKVLELLRCENCGQLFIGGNRKRETNDGSVSLTLNFPNLEQIPNFNPTPMVQNKTYQDYAIFWPKDLNTPINIPEGKANQGGGDHVVVISTGECAYCNGKAQWVPGYLDSLTGKFTPKDQSLASNTGSLMDNSIKTNGIQGFLYRVVNNNNGAEIDDIKASKIYAAPCTCPHCLQDYTLRKYTNSPIRSFRTGIDRSNQILSKELLYQLDDNSAKLIGFSDSREDAAKQALGIEKEQYRDMVRMLFVECVDEIEDPVSKVKLFVDTERNNVQDDDDIIDLVEEKLTFIEDASKIARKYIAGKDLSAFVSTNTIKLSKLIGDGFDGILVRKLLERGINPAGEVHKFQWYEVNGQRNHWSTAYDFDNYCLRDRTITNIDDDYVKEIYTRLENAVFANSFGKYMGVSVLDAGIGYISGPQSDAIESSNEYQTLRRLLPSDVSVYEFVDAFIRVMGDNYLYPSIEEGNAYVDYEHLKGSVKRPIKEFCKKRGGDETSLGDALVRYLKKNCTNPHTLCLELKKLSFTKMTNGKYMKCPKCGRVHPNRGFGFCTNTSCMEKLDPSVTVDTDSLHDHYISFDILKEKKAPRRLHTEELSGQTDDIQARLREFKDLILIDDNDPTKLGKEMTMPIDMVCVTTTMEVGVDIGSLQAIFQGNMPPTRYNYQQRVGRAGRRGQAFSAAVTFCRGRSHDNYYYYNATEEMTGGIPASPTIAVNPCMGSGLNLVIVKRIILKHILMLISANRADWAIRKGSTVGQLGETGSQTGDWDNNVRPVIKEWIDNHQEDICHIIKYYLAQYLSTDKLEDVCKSLLAWINNEVLPLMDEAISSSSSTDNAQAIAEAGLLPLYGMPTSIRSLYHNAKRSRNPHNGWTENITGKIERPIDQAITDFAPGAIKTKDSAEYKVAGLTVPLDYLPQFDNENELKEHSQDLDPLQYSYNLTVDAEGSITSIGRYDPNQIKEDTTYRLVIPKAFRTDKIVKNDGSLDQNEDSRSNYTPVSIWVDAQSQHQTPVANGAGRWEAWNGDHQKAIIWTVNDNNRDFFTGHRAWKSINVNEVTEPIFFKHDVSDQLKERLKEYAPNFMIDSDVTEKYWQPANETQKIALGTKKVTDTLCLSLDPNKIPSTLCLDALHGNRAAIVAAFYSAATLIQRTFADQIDIDPQEIEISEVKIDEITGLSSVYLNDKAPNGAGFISLLCSNDKDGQLRLEKIMKDIVSPSPESKFIKHIISDEHKKSCVTSCPKCLNTFYNRGLHHVLDWRLGMDVIKLMLDNHYEMGFHNLKETPYGDLPELMNEVGIRVSNAFPDKSVNYVNNDGTDWHSGMFRTRANGIWKIEHLVHPLWNVYDQEQQDGYKAQNVFVLQRNVKMPPIEFEPDPNRQALGAQIDQSQAPTDNSNSSDDGYGSLG